MSSAEPAEDAPALRRELSGLLARRSVDAGQFRRRIRCWRWCAGMAVTGLGGLLTSVSKPVTETELNEAEGREPGLSPARSRAETWATSVRGSGRRRS